MPPLVLTNKTVVVTGANRGIGLELVKQILAKNNRIVATAREPAEATDLQRLASGSDGRVQVMQLDTSSSSSIQQFAKQLNGTVTQVDLLINNAGVANWADLGDVTEEDMMQTFQTNTVGPLLCTQQLHKQGLLQKGSFIANMTSKMGSVECWRASPADLQRGADDNGSGGSYAYRASKAALNIVNKSLSIDLGRQGITCVLLHPGYVKTRMTGHSGLIDTRQCVEGLLRVLESKQQLNGRWFDYKGEEIPW